jgi:chromosome segregation protein
LKIDKVRIAGFKSFADPVEFPVPPGITGIVGPNGCGKSNLIEALRWAMGETSAKRMRAEGMDDVIFGGTETRPARASCEVSVFIENSERRAPAEFNNADTLVAVRRLDRGDGSSYRVNGVQARARDVQTLFQDAGIGAGSAALVSQGKVASIIQSKPSERRSILEEAAGISGLASRRRDAEIRLRATEQNLEKAATLERGLGEQLVSLRKQARQAARRRALDDLIKASEATSFLVRWNAAVARKVSIDAAHLANEKNVVEAIVSLKASESTLAATEIEVAPAMQLRAEAETAAVISRAASDAAEKDIANSANAANAAARMADRAAADVEHDKVAIDELRETIEDLSDRKAIAEDGIEQDAERIEEATTLVEAAEAEVGIIAAKVEAMASQVASSDALLKSLEENKRKLEARRKEIEGRIAAIRERIQQDEASMARLNAFSDDLEAADRAVVELTKSISTLSEECAAAAVAEMESRRKVVETESLLNAVRSEAEALKSVARREGSLTSEFRVDEGMEGALAAALGETLAAGLTENGGKWWESSVLRVSPPKGTVPLSTVVSVPEQMVAAISGVGVVSGTPDAQLIADLDVGQSIVSTDGILWRWDGYRTSETGVAAAALRRAAKLQSLIAEDERLSGVLLGLRTEFGTRTDNLAALRHREAEASAEIKKAVSRLDEARRTRQRTSDERNSVSARLLASETILASVLADADQIVGQLGTCGDEIAALPPADEMIASLASLRASLVERRNAQAATTAARDRIRREADLRVTTITAVTSAIDDATRKLSAAGLRHTELTARLTEARTDLARKQEISTAAPQVAKDARERFQDAADNLASVIARVSEGERRLSEHRSAARQAADALAGLREINAGIIVEMKALNAAEEELRREISERLTCEPQDLQRLSGIAEGDDLPDAAACDARVGRLVKEREALGVVNLLAEQQVEEIESRVGEAKKAMDELRETVTRLRRSITEFDREARSRLTEAFVAIDGHFKALFTRLFGGGHAHLKLSGSDDPLEAGLEVYACPPGKKLQSMSLLSGGEQALAALALVFAIFMVNPAPVCVLDEVDAPLDDANVNRLCELVADMAANDATRFLVVTHHTLTMSKADRLYGVTMSERGVSRLATLDMAEAAAFVGA